MPRWNEESLRIVVAESSTFTQVLKRFGLRAAGGNFGTLSRWLETWAISTEHFDHGGDRLAPFQRPAAPLDQVLVEHSTYSRATLKRRLYREGIKRPTCELCGQGETWQGNPMSLILDHVNGVHDDNRLDNLRIVCPNCNATLPTHCGRNVERRLVLRCARCDVEFKPKTGTQRFCSRACGQRHDRSGRARPGARSVEHPPHEQLLAEIAATSWSAVGRKYGVSDNAIRKWVRVEERARAAAQTARAASDGRRPDPSHAPQHEEA